MNVYVIVVTYNPKKWIDRCFSSLRNSTIPLSIIVIDNASTDESQEIIKDNFPEIDFIQSNENLGFGAANNIGMRLAYNKGADYVFLLNQDAWIEANTIELLVNANLNEPDYDIISPMHLNGDGTQLDFMFSVFIEPRKCPDLYSDLYSNNIKNKLYPVEFVNAAAWLLTKKCIEVLGGFSPIFYHYGEDDNYCLRAHYHQLKIGIYPKTKIYHDKEYQSNPFEYNENVYHRQQLVKYSNPNTFNSIYDDIQVYKMSAIKSLLKLNRKLFKHSVKEYKRLKSIKNNIKRHVELSKLKGAHFLD